MIDDWFMIQSVQLPICPPQTLQTCVKWFELCCLSVFVKWSRPTPAHGAKGEC